jgi:hypothetical protein
VLVSEVIFFEFRGWHCLFICLLLAVDAGWMIGSKMTFQLLFFIMQHLGVRALKYLNNSRHIPSKSMFLYSPPNNRIRIIITRQGSKQAQLEPKQQGSTAGTDKGQFGQTAGQR